MEKQPQSRAPLIVAIALLLLPVLYAGSYLALVEPEGVYHVCMSGNSSARSLMGHYRFYSPITDKVFWPLEQVDRKVRPGAWDAPEPDVDPCTARAEDEGLGALGATDNDCLSQLRREVGLAVQHAVPARPAGG
jgi:hypothetical protein